MIDWVCDHFWVLVAMAGILLTTMVVAFGLKFICCRLNKRFRSSSESSRRNVILQGLFYGLSAPLQLFIWIFGLSLIAELFLERLEDLPHVSIGFGRLRGLVFILCFAWFVMRTRSRIESLFSGHRLKGKVLAEQTQVEAIGKLVTLLVLVVVGVSVLSVFGVDMRALLTIGGLGTVAVGLAGKDVFANFFSGFMLYLTRPFKIGDRIASPDRELEGFIEHIGWYMTRIMTLEKLPTYIPNSIFSTVTISNYARMRNRRMKEMVGLRYKDLPLLPQIITEIQQMLKDHADIDQSQSIYVAFTGYGDFSLQVVVQVVTRTPVWGHFLAVRQDVLLKVGEIAQKHGADFAFPTTTLDMPGHELPPSE